MTKIASRIFLTVALVPLVVFVLARALMVKRIGGTTGDTAGALIEMLEVAVLLGCVFTV